MMEITDRIIEEIRHGEKKITDFPETSREEITRRVAELNESDKEILARYSPAMMKKAVEEKMKGETKDFAKDIKKVSMHKKVVHLRYVAYAAAAVFAFAVILPVGLNNSKTSAISEQSAERVKGGGEVKSKGPYLNLYRLDGDEIQSLKNGESAEKGDMIQIAYNSCGDKYGVIFSVDGNGTVTRHFPDYGWTAGEFDEPEGLNLLDFSYELDDAPEYECFIFVTSKEQFTLNNIEDNFVNKNEKYIEKGKFLPKKTRKSIFILAK